MSVCEAVERRSGNVLRFFRPAECDEQPADGIYFWRFDVDGQPLGSTVRIETDPGATAGRPSVAAFGDNRFLIAAPVSGTAGGLVRIERYDDEGSLVEPVEVEAGGAFLRPRMSCSRGGSRCVAVWEEEGGVIALVIAPTSLQRSSRVRIVENEDSTVATDPDVACDPTSRCLVTWLRVREEVVDDMVFSEPIGRFGRVLNARTRGLGGTEAIDRATEALELDGPVVVSLATSRYVAASADNDAISLQRFSLRTE